MGTRPKLIGVFIVYFSIQNCVVYDGKRRKLFPIPAADFPGTSRYFVIWMPETRASLFRRHAYAHILDLFVFSILWKYYTWINFRSFYTQNDLCECKNDRIFYIISFIFYDVLMNVLKIKIKLCSRKNWILKYFYRTNYVLDIS